MAAVASILVGVVEGVKDVVGAVLPGASPTAAGQVPSTSAGPERLPTPSEPHETQG